jgi:hypothetical protein
MVGLVFVARQYGMLCGTPFEFLATSCGTHIQAEPHRDPATASRTSTETTHAVKPSVLQAAIVLKTSMTGYQVIVNGRPAVVSNGQFNVPLKEELRIEVRKLGYQTQRFAVPPLEKAGTYGYEVPAVPVPMGAVIFNTLPEANVAFYLGDEKVFEGLTPVKGDFPAGKYRIHIENSLLGLKTDHEFMVEENKVNREEITLNIKK